MFVFLNIYCLLLSFCLTILFLQKLILKVCRCYNVFCSGANHSLYAILVQFLVETLGRKVLLLRGAGTRMASYFYAMFRILRLKSVLGITVSSDEVKKLTLTRRTQACIKDIKNEKFFRACYAVAKVTYPALKLLRYCDKASPVMGVLYHLSLRTTAALEHHAETLNEPHLFALGADGDVQQEVDEVFGPDMQVYNQTVDSIEEARERGEDSDGSEVLNSQMSLHARFVWEWNKRKVKIEHEYAKAGFALSVSPDVWAHASQPQMLGPRCGRRLKMWSRGCTRSQIQTRRPCK